MAITPTRAINVARQLIAITAALPDAAGTTRRGVLDCRLRIQPSPASQTYTVRLIYRHGRPPKVTVTDPPLALHPDASQLPHVIPETSCASTTPASGSTTCCSPPPFCLGLPNG